MMYHSNPGSGTFKCGIFLLAAILCLPFSGIAQATLTRIFIVRHADRDGNNDDLTAAGVTRSYELKRVLANSKIDSIYTTNYVRTKKTMQPLAKSRSISAGIYSNPAQLARQLMSQKAAGKTMLVVGHSNTVDDLIRGCGCTPPASISPEMPVTQYDNLFLVLLQTVPGQRKPKCELLHLKYGAVTN
jgi:phosphohistidine phosphatase SixA